MFKDQRNILFKVKSFEPICNSQKKYYLLFINDEICHLIVVISLEIVHREVKLQKCI